MKSLFSFDNLITPSIIKFLFYVGVAVVSLGALGMLVVGANEPSYSPIPGFAFFLLAIVFFVVGILLVRVGAEVTLVAFMIRDELAWQRVNKTTPEVVPMAPLA